MGSTGSIYLTFPKQDMLKVVEIRLVSRLIGGGGGLVIFIRRRGWLSTYGGGMVIYIHSVGSRVAYTSKNSCNHTEGG